MKLLLGFDTLFTPKMLVVCYWLSMIAIIIAGLIAMKITGFIVGATTIVLSLIFCRVMYELIMIAFKNNEYLRRIAENTGAKH